MVRNISVALQRMAQVFHFAGIRTELDCSTCPEHLQSFRADAGAPDPVSRGVAPTPDQEPVRSFSRRPSSSWQAGRVLGMFAEEAASMPKMTRKRSIRGLRRSECWPTNRQTQVC
jgi:hypothetical protein